LTKTNRFISVRKINGIITGGNTEYVEVWEVPSDFTVEEERLLSEICANGVLGPADGKECVLRLRN
jgi:hypothetical protein